jgi:ABC-type nitrate/sulfonate/bicarbonate transport system substrate-binding protein
MRNNIACVLVVLGGVMSACVAQPPTDEPPAATEFAASDATTAPRKSGTIRVSLQGALSAREVPWMMALDSLREQGYTVEVVSLGRSDLIPEALLRGDLHFGSVNPNVLWVAIAKGADLRTIGAKNNLVFRLAAKPDIRTCRDLDGRAVAFNTTRATNKAMFDAYVRRQCPGITPRVVIVGESANRVVALQSGEIDSAMLELDEWLYLEEHAPGRFHILVNIAEEFSEIQNSSFAVSNRWATENPEVVKDLLRTMLTVYRRVVENPRLLQEENAKRLSMDAVGARKLADAFLAANVWDLNGGWTAATVRNTMEFLVSQGSVPAGLEADDVADLSYLNAVLDEIGRR